VGVDLVLQRLESQVGKIRTEFENNAAKELNPATRAQLYSHHQDAKSLEKEYHAESSRIRAVLDDITLIERWSKERVEAREAKEKAKKA